MSEPGMGGLIPPPINAPAGQPTPVGVQPGVSGGIVRARQVIVSGPSGSVVGVFVYAVGTTPGLGNGPIASMTNQPDDPFGNPTEPGVASYVTSGDRIALQLGLGSFAGTPAPGIFIHDMDSPANSDPVFGAVQANAANCSAVLFSGKSLAGSTGSGIQATDSTGSGVAGGEVDVVAGLCNIQQNAQVGGNLTVGGVLTITSANSLVTGDVNLNPPMATPPHYVLPTDTNSGSSWGIGERQFINNCVDAINSIIASMANRGFF